MTRKGRALRAINRDRERCMIAAANAREPIRPSSELPSEREIFQGREYERKAIERAEREAQMRRAG